MATTSNPLPVPSGYYPPFAVVTDKDHTAWIIIATALSLSLILLFSAIMAFIRYTVSATIHADETFFAASTSIAIIQSCIVLVACSKGLGKSIDLVPDDNMVEIQQIYYVSILLFILSLGLSKLSVVFLLLRLTPSDKHRRIFNGTAALITAWTVAAIFALALQCNLSRPWILVGQTCPGAFLRWQIISAFDIAFEMCLVGMTIYLVWSILTSVETKMAVVFSFGMRLPLIITVAYRLSSFDVHGLTTNPTLLEDKFIVWTQAELGYSIIAATIPGLRPFIKTLSTNYGSTIANDYGRYGNGSEGLVSSHANDTGGDSALAVSYQLMKLRPSNKGDEYKYRIWSGESRDSRSGRADQARGESSDSRQMIIRKHLSWEVEAEENRTMSK